jgi:hypothetical protein
MIRRSLLPLLLGERPPDLTTCGEPSFCLFAHAAEIFHQRDLADELVEIERALNAYGVSLEYLFPWLEMQREIKLLGQWKAMKAPRGARPKVDLRRDADALARLITSEAITSAMKPWLVAEHARLVRLLSRPGAFQRLPTAWPLLPIAVTLDDVPRLVKSLERRSVDGAPGKWSDIIRGAYAMLVPPRGTAARADAIRLLNRALVALFPWWWAPAGAEKRLRALVAYVPHRTTMARAVSHHLRESRSRGIPTMPPIDRDGG